MRRPRALCRRRPRLRHLRHRLHPRVHAKRAAAAGEDGRHGADVRCHERRPQVGHFKIDK